MGAQRMIEQQPAAVSTAGYKDDRAKLFLAVLVDITRDNSHTQRMGTFRLAVRKTFPTRCSREVMVVPL